MPPKLTEGYTVGITGEIAIVHDDGSVTLRLRGYDIPITTRGEHVSLIAKRKAEPVRRRPLRDMPD